MRDVRGTGLRLEAELGCSVMKSLLLDRLREWLSQLVCRLLFCTMMFCGVLELVLSMIGYVLVTVYFLRFIFCSTLGLYDT
jgi:hypothetical protein